MGRFGDFFDARIHRNPLPSSAPPPRPAADSIVVPKLAEVVGGVVAMLRESGRTPVPVVDTGQSAGWPRVFVLGQLSPKEHDAGTAFAEVALDGSGRLALFHEVQVAAHGSWVVPIGSSALEQRYRRQVGAIGTSREAQTFPIILDRGGELMIMPVWRPEYMDEVPLSRYLYALAEESGGLPTPSHVTAYAPADPAGAITRSSSAKTSAGVPLASTTTNSAKPGIEL